MGTLAQVLYPVNLAWDGTVPSGGSIERLDDAAPTTVSHTTNFGTGSGEKILQPQSNNIQGAVADADKKGFALNYFGTDGMDSLADAKRFLNAANWSFIGCHAGLALTVSTFRVRIRIYRVSADGLTRTLIGGPTDSAASPNAPAPTNWSVTIAMPEVIFEAGESFMASYGVVKNANSVISEDVTLFVGPDNSGLGNVNTITLPSPGIRTRYIRDLADAGPVVTDDLTRIVTFPRALVDAGPVPTDDLVRAFTGARDLADLGPVPTDDLQRAATFPRALDDLGPAPVDDLLRQFTANRALADVGPSPTDDLVRAFTGARDLVDDGPQITDALARQVTYARLIEDDISGSTIIETHPIFGLFD